MCCRIGGPLQPPLAAKGSCGRKRAGDAACDVQQPSSSTRQDAHTLRPSPRWKRGCKERPERRSTFLASVCQLRGQGLRSLPRVPLPALIVSFVGPRGAHTGRDGEDTRRRRWCCALLVWCQLMTSAHQLTSAPAAAAPSARKRGT